MINSIPSVVSSKSSVTTVNSKSTSTDGFRTIKILEATALQLEKLSEQVNGSGPKRVQWKDMVNLAVTKITKGDLDKLRQEKMTSSDRFEEMCKSYLEKNPGSSRDDFLEAMLKNAKSPSNADSKEVKNG